MVILSSTITVSIGLTSMLIILIVVAILTIFVGINVAMSKKHEKLTRYKEDYISGSYKVLHRCVLYCGMIVVPLFKQTIIDARHFIHLKGEESKYQQESMWRMGDEDQTDRQHEKVMFERGMKLLKLKYKRKNFVVRKVFTIFVSK